MRKALTKFYVRPNLYRALRRLREPAGFDIALWIDAICIDQGSNGEKTHQLPNMLSIYHFCANTRIWLGENIEGRIAQERGMVFVEDIVSIGFLGQLLEDQDRTRDWLAFAELLTKDWFSRRWIIQEVAACRFATIRFGGIEIKWPDFADAIEIFYRGFEQIRKASLTDSASRSALEEFYQRSLPAKALVETTINVFRHWKGSKLQSRWSLERLVLKLNRFLVSDPRDTIYAVLGIANDNISKTGMNPVVDEQILVGNYSKMPLEVYIDFIQYVVSKTRSLDIILRRWAAPITNWSTSPSSEEQDKTSSNLPSWIGVVDSPSSLEQTFIGDPAKCPYRACQDTVAQCSFGVSNQVYDGTITAKGIILGMVAKMSQVVSSLNDVMETLDLLEYPMNVKTSVAGILWRTLVGDRDSGGANPPRWYQRACLYWITHESSELELVTAYQKRVKEVVVNRKLFTYQEPDGSYQQGGVGPCGVQTGDFVCILLGCSVPVILREKKEATNDAKTYTLIGECYVHRKMEGERFFSLDQESIKAQSSTFKIR
jgi:hypothetical protein